MYRVFDLTTSLTPAATQYATLIAALQALTLVTTSLSPATTSGIVTGVSANGHSVTYAETGQYSTTADDFSGNSAFMRDVYTESRLALISAGIAAPTDPQIFDEMMFRISPATEIGPSCFSGLRCA